MAFRDALANMLVLIRIFMDALANFLSRYIAKDATGKHLLPMEEFAPCSVDVAKNLPMEIVIRILSYLTPSDRHEAGLTCHRWFEAAHHTAFLGRFWLELRKLNGDQPPVRMLLDSFRHFPNIELQEVDFTELGSFFQRFGPKIRCIKFGVPYLQEHALFDILRHLSGLRSLSIHCHLVESQGMFYNQTERAALSQTLSGVTELSLFRMKNLSDAMLHRLMEIMPSLSSLCLAGCDMSFYPELYWDLYPSDRKPTSESVLTFHYVLQVIAERKRSFRALDFSQTSIDHNELKALVAIGPDLQLECLALDGILNTSFYEEGLKLLLRAQAAHLRQLHLSQSLGLTDSCLLQICREMSGLRVLKLRGCLVISNRGVRQVAKLPQLEVLDVSNCKAINGEGILDGIASRRNETLRELYLRRLDLSELSIIAITENLPQLRVLDLGSCSNTMSDLCLQFICRNLVHLKQLMLDHCYKLSDGGLTGLGFLEESSTTAFRGYSIGRLQQLQVLDLAYCENLSDVSLFNLRLLELHELSLKSCEKVTHEGIRALVRGCPAIGKLDLSFCYNITDEAVHHIALHLRRLQELYLAYCNLLTNDSLGYIARHCHRLRVLKVWGCRQMDYNPRGCG